MKSFKVIKSMMLMALLFIFAISVTYAWISYSDRIDGGGISTGELNYTYQGSFVENGTVIVPGQELIVNAFVVDNQSTIDSQLRLKIIYTLVEETASQKVYKNESTDDLAVVFDQTLVLVDDYWYYPSFDDAITTTGSIALVSSLMYDGFKASNEYRDQVISIGLVIQVKQADFVSWNDLATINFTTGNPA